MYLLLHVEKQFLLSNIFLRRVDFLLFKTIRSSSHSTLIARENHIRCGQVPRLLLQLVQSSQRRVYRAHFLHHFVLLHLKSRSRSRLRKDTLSRIWKWTCTFRNRFSVFNLPLPFPWNLWLRRKNNSSQANTYKRITN